MASNDDDRNDNNNGHHNDDEFTRSHVHREGPETSREAADRVSSVEAHCMAILRVLAEALPDPGFSGLICEEIAERAGIDPWAASKRISDLHNAEEIEVVLKDDGEIDTRNSSKGRRCQKYTISHRGLDRLGVGV